MAKKSLAAVPSVRLAWDASTDPSVAGYRIYQGLASRNYSNMLDAGASTNLTVAGLVPGLTNYFAATAYTAAGLESDFSSEVAYVSPLPATNILLVITAEASPDLATWSTLTNYPAVLLSNPPPAFFRLKIVRQNF